MKKLEKQRRREGKNLAQRPLWKAKKNFNKIQKQESFFPKKIKQRIEMIQKNWTAFTAFYLIKGCPATNNALENFYTTSLKTHRKKQLRTDKGLLNHMKLSAFKRIKKFNKPKRTLLEIYGSILLIVS